MTTARPEPGSVPGAHPSAETASAGGAAQARESPKPPFFIIGCPRSGTTLLSVMVNAHPQLAVPPESHFVVALAPPRRLGGLLRAASVEDILPYLASRQWKVDHDAVRSAVRKAGPRSYPALVSTVFSAYAGAQGKPRWGDKTPRHVDHVDTLAELFPNARFIHLIRDGREVAASLADRRWGPRNAVVGAFVWRRSLTRARRAGRRLGGRYMELRLEDLISEPERRLRGLCDFLGEEYAPEMLRYAESERAAQAAETGFRNVLKPPTAGLRDWRRGLTPRQQRAVEAVCHELLVELSYPAPDPSLGDRAYALATLGLRAPALALAGASATLARYLPRVALPGRRRRRRDAVPV